MKINSFAQEIYFEVEPGDGLKYLWKVTFVVVKSGFMVNVQNVSANNQPVYSLGFSYVCNIKTAETALNEVLLMQSKTKSNETVKN